MYKFAAAAGLALLMSVSSLALASPSSCYTAKEVEAEQGIRIHSELMVIGLTCLNMPQGAEMYSKYQSFTQKNHRLIAQYENEMISYYKRAGYDHPEQKLHTLRTTMANEISQHAITMSIVTFCHTFGPRVDKALHMDQKKIREWAQHSWVSAPTSRPACTTTARL